MASPSNGLPPSFAGEHHFLTSFPDHRLPGTHGNIIYHPIPEDLFETREHAGGVVITGIKQEYFDNEGLNINGNIIIPGLINGKPVVEIGASVFRGFSITGVQFPSTIASIQGCAFSECRGLRSVEFSGVNPVFCGHEAFMGTQLSGPIDNLRAIIPDGAIPFPSGCVIEQVTFGPTPAMNTVIGNTRGDVAEHLPIYIAPSTFPSYYPPTGRPPNSSDTSR